MKASQLITDLQQLVIQHGDLDMLYEYNGCFEDIGSVRYMREYALPPVFMISDRKCIDITSDRVLLWHKNDQEN